MCERFHHIFVDWSRRKWFNLRQLILRYVLITNISVLKRYEYHDRCTGTTLEKELQREQN